MLGLDVVVGVNEILGLDVGSEVGALVGIDVGCAVCVGMNVGDDECVTTGGDCLTVGAADGTSLA